MIGPIVERKSQSRPVIAPSLDKLGKQRGFPLAQRRTSPAVENRDRQIASSAQPASSSSSHENTRAFAPNSSDLYERDSVENERRVADMSDEERGRERAEIIARFGSGIGDLLKRVKESRTKTMSDAVNSGVRYTIYTKL